MMKPKTHSVVLLLRYRRESQSSMFSFDQPQTDIMMEESSSSFGSAGAVAPPPYALTQYEGFFTSRPINVGGPDLESSYKRQVTSPSEVSFSSKSYCGSSSTTTQQPQMSPSLPSTYYQNLPAESSPSQSSVTLQRPPTRLSSPCTSESRLVLATR